MGRLSRTSMSKDPHFLGAMQHNEPPKVIDDHENGTSEIELQDLPDNEAYGDFSNEERESDVALARELEALSAKVDVQVDNVRRGTGLGFSMPTQIRSSKRTSIGFGSNDMNRVSLASQSRQVRASIIQQRGLEAVKRRSIARASLRMSTADARVSWESEGTAPSVASSEPIPRSDLLENSGRIPSIVLEGDEDEED